MAERIGELQSKRDLYSKHFLNSDGSITAEISGVPVHYRDGEQFKVCELNLIEERNWEFEYAVKKNNFRAYFNDTTDLENYTLASFEIINSQGISRWINYKLFGAKPTEDAVIGNTILYKNCFPNVDLKYHVDTWRLKEDIIINAPVGNFEYEFSLKLDGARLEQQQDGSILFVDINTEEILWRIEKPYAKDAENKITYGVQYALGKVIYNGIEYDSVKVKVVDEEFLQNAAYPIVIDPTTASYNVSMGAHDGQWSKSTSTYNYYGTYADDTADCKTTLSYMYILKSNYSTYYTIRNVFIRINTESIPDNAIISTATLNMTSGGLVNKVDNRKVLVDYYDFGATLDTNDWVRENVGDANAGVFMSALPTVKGTKYSFPLLNPNTKINKTGYTGFRLGIDGLAPTGENNYNFDTYESSTDASTLSVTYNVPPTAPKVLTPNGGETYNASATITWSASADPDGDTLTYEIDYSTDNGSTWTNITTSATGTSYVWNCSAVSASTTCLVRIMAKDSGGLYSAYDQSDAVFTIRHNFGKKIIGVQAPAKIMGSVAMKVLGNS